ncbi:unnamed protein product [Dracunculus medinensis]|uniref:DAG1 domain-containing protein n=1 Tax=Dracunculus medinensis TaxID=318479 RepID=A0A0N4UCX9_DRAME|nr:unnamed protein product [Dracunculus medinensis]
MEIMEGTLLMTMNTPHKQGAFDMDDKAVLRSILVIIIIAAIIFVWLVFKFYRHGKNHSRVRRYDLLSAKQLMPDLITNSDESEDEVFGTLAMRESTRQIRSDITT